MTLCMLAGPGRSVVFHFVLCMEAHESDGFSCDGK